MAWETEKKERVIAAYEKANPTPETSMEIVKEIAEAEDESPNGVRIILSKAEVYIKKVATAKTSENTGTTRVSKASAQEALTKALSDAGQKVEEDIVSKLTGKAAQYFTNIVTALND